MHLHNVNGANIWIFIISLIPVQASKFGYKPLKHVFDNYYAMVDLHKDQGPGGAINPH